MEIETAKRRANANAALQKSALVLCQAGPVDQVDTVTTAVIADGLDGHLETVLGDDVAIATAAETEAEMILAVEDLALEAEDEEDQKVEAMAHAIRVETRSTRRKESQVAIAADPEIEAI